MSSALRHFADNAQLTDRHFFRHSNGTAPPVAVTLPSLEFVSVYSAWKLWLAYGIAISITFVVAAAGAGMMWVSQACYSDNFSTVFRVAQDAHVNVQMQSADLSGCNSLPNHLTEAQVSLIGSVGKTNSG